MKIGKYELDFHGDKYLSFLTEDDVWVKKNGEEAAQFNKHELFKRLEDAIDRFWEENF